MNFYIPVSKMIKRNSIHSLFFIAYFIVSPSLFAAKVDTVLTYSASMKKDIKAVVITPDNYSKTTPYNVVYLLHGYSGNYADWVSKVPAIKNMSDQYNIILVCPDGNFGSWYFDSPVDSSWRYETYITKELIKFIDDHYSTHQSREGRAITGLSMGGHGALYLAFRHQDVFGATGSMSGGVDIRPFPLNWDLSKRLGSYKDHPENWEKNSVINLVYLLTPRSIAITFDCGTDDFFYGVNKELHEKLLERNIPHDFTVRPGAHTWSYWSNSIQYQMVFFNNYFHPQEKK
ncbi:MAG: alpha/beta hydrolase family protein [Ginsengibacter sp.]